MRNNIEDFQADLKELAMEKIEIQFEFKMKPIEMENEFLEF